MALTLHTTIVPRGSAAAIVLTDEHVSELGGGKRAAVTVTIDDVTARLRLARMGGENLIGMSKATRAELGVEAGQDVDAVIEVDRAERNVEVPAELSAALAEAQLTDSFAAWSYSKRKEAARSVSEAKAAETKQRRVAKVLDQLAP